MDGNNTDVNKSDGLFDKQALATRSFIHGVRVNVLKDLVDPDGSISDPKKIRLFETVAVSTEESMLRTAELMQKESADTAGKEVVLSALAALHMSKANNAKLGVADSNVVIDADVAATAITTGGDILNMKDFVLGDSDD